MIVYYFGADSPWFGQDETTIRRRNMAILLTLSQQPSVEKVVNVVRTTRKGIFKTKNEKSSENPNIINLYIAPIVPERGALKIITRSINQFLLKRMNPSVFQNSLSNQKLAWCYWPQGFEDFEFLGLDMEMVFDTDHNIIDDPNVLNEKKSQRTKLLLRAGKKAKYVLSSSRSMLDWYHNNGFSNTQLVMNGVFEDRIDLEPITIVNKPYQVTYCGTLSKWLKMDWLLKIINEKPDWKFTIIGDNYKSEVSSKLEQISNVELLGYLEPKEVDSVIKQSNVCFGLYQKDKALDVNSMKLYDYLAQGVSVVVNEYHPNLNQDFADLLNIASTYEEFKSLLEQPNSFSKQKIENFLMSATWNQKIQPIIEPLND